MSVKWGDAAHDHPSAITMAVMDAVDRAIRATRPRDPKAAAIAGLLGAVLAFLAREGGQDAARELPRLAREVADQLVRASLMLARTLARTRDREVH